MSRPLLLRCRALTCYTRLGLGVSAMKPREFIASRRSIRRVAARGASAAGGDAGGRLPEQRVGRRIRAVHRCIVLLWRPKPAALPANDVVSAVALLKRGARLWQRLTATSQSIK